MVIYTQASVERVRQRMQRQVSKAQNRWEQTCWHLSNRRFGCRADARTALERELKGKPVWLDVHCEVKAHPQHGSKGRPRKDASRQFSPIKLSAAPDIRPGRRGARLSLSQRPLFLASSVTVSKPERIMALSFIMVLCLLVYRLAEFRLRARLAETEQTIPDQVHKATARPTMRWIFQCFEGIELLHIQTATTSRVVILRLQPLHRLILQ